MVVMGAAMKMMTLKYPTKCGVCGMALAVGETAAGIKNENSKWTFRCRACKDVGAAADSKLPRGEELDLVALERVLGEASGSVLSVPEAPVIVDKPETLEDYLNRLQESARWRIA